MISNKLKLATATVLTAAMSMPVLAAIDMDVTTDQKLKYATELQGTATAGYVTAAKQGTDGTINGSVDVTSTAAAVKTRFLRYDLTNAKFKGDPGLNVMTGADAGGAACNVVLAGVLVAGGDGDAFATFSTTMAADKFQAATCDWTLTQAARGLDLVPDATASVTYTIYETLGQTGVAANTIATAKSVDYSHFIVGSTPAEVVTATDATATVASDFRSFDNTANGIANGTLTSIGFIDASKAIKTGVSTIQLDGSAADETHFLTAAQNIVVTGDVSQGTWFANTTVACAGGTSTACVANTAKTACTVTLASGANADQHICAQFSGLDTGLKVNKGTYSVAMSVDTDATGALGKIKYDTISVEVPYITTYEGYNQRIFIDNFGTTSATYSTTFTSETGVTATAGTAATGTLAAGAVSTVKVGDMVTFAGGSRGTATLELEANGANLRVVSQIVDLGTGMTDTILLHPSTQQ